MGAGDDRKAWVRSVIATQCGGNAAAFGRKIGKDSSYVSRMLATDTKQRRGISDETVGAILKAFPKLETPAWFIRASAANQHRQSIDPATEQLEAALVSLALALGRYAPDVAAEFDQNFSELAKKWPVTEKFPAVLSAALRRNLSDLKSQSALPEKANPRKAAK